MNNFSFDITSRGSLSRAMDVAFSQAKTATHYAQLDASAGLPGRLAFYWNDPGIVSALAFPFRMKPQQAAAFAEQWLAEASYPPEPRMEGRSTRGWRMSNATWTPGDNGQRGILALMPTWAIHAR